MAAISTMSEYLEGGLSSEQAEELLRVGGPNELPRGDEESWFARIARQLREPMALLLIVAALVSGFALDEIIDGVAILAIVVVNAAIGFFQETRAARALEALRDLQTPIARVVRDGSPRSIPAADVVVGDRLILAGGDRVAADGELTEAVALEVDESLLTGESLPIEKSVLEDPALYAGTFVTAGMGSLEVLATGSNTRMAAIAAKLDSEKPATPLQAELRALSWWLGAIAIAAAALVFALVAVSSSEHFLEDAFLAAISIAVAAVPEGLATVVTVALALGVRRMAGRGAIVRHLPSVETLGATTVIATDKTGTLTENRMRVALAVDAGGAPAVGDIHAELVRAVAACNDAALDPPSGDPMEVALLIWAEVRRPPARLKTFPFDPRRKAMSTVHAAPSGFVVYTKGAPEQILARSTRFLAPDRVTRTFTQEDRARLGELVELGAKTGMRMLAVAERAFEQMPGSASDAEVDLVLIGFVGLRDPLRPQARTAVETARAAGVQVVMVTGDHPGTAQWVAEEVGISTSPGSSVTPDGRAATPTVYARVSPEEKLELVRSLQERGEVVAVTGDGVNDGPALRGANIGIAMGQRGTDVARAASDIVITDDNLETIVHAISEGRSIYDNVRRVVQYLVAANLSEILVVVIGLLVFPDLIPPLLPLQLLWINLVTDGFPALALGVDPASPSAMRRGPRRLGSRLMGPRGLTTVGVRASVFAASCLAAVAALRWMGHDGADASRTALFVALALSQLIYSFVVRRPAIGPWGGRDAEHRMPVNPWLICAFVLGMLLVVVPVSTPGLQDVFGLADFTLAAWSVSIAAAVVPNLLIVGLEPPSRRA